MVFIDQVGRYYQAEKVKDAGDAFINFPTPQMLEYLTEIPVTMPEFGTQVKEKEVEKLAVPQTVLSKVENVSEEQLKTL